MVLWLFFRLFRLCLLLLRLLLCSSFFIFMFIISRRRTSNDSSSAVIGLMSNNRNGEPTVLAALRSQERRSRCSTHKTLSSGPTGHGACSVSDTSTRSAQILLVVSSSVHHHLLFLLLLLLLLLLPSYIHPFYPTKPRPFPSFFFPSSENR